MSKVIEVMQLIILCIYLMFIKDLKCESKAGIRILDESEKADLKLYNKNLVKILIDAKDGKLENFQLIPKYITTGKYYCMQNSSGYFLKWDGNSGYNWDQTFGYGLIYTSIDNCLTDKSYQFEFIIRNNEIRLKNRATNMFITYFYSNVYYRQFFYLTDTDNSDHYTGLNIYEKSDGYINIQSNSSTYPYYISNEAGTSGLNNLTILFSNLMLLGIANFRFINVSQPSNYTLNANIGSFEFENLNESIINEYISEFNLINPTIINNTSPSKITHQISDYEIIEEKISYKFYQSLETFDKIKITRNLPKIIQKRFKFTKVNTKSFSFNNTVPEYESVYNRKYSIQKTVEIPAQTAVEIEANVNIVTDLKIKFRANGVITSNDSISGEEIKSILESKADFEKLEVRKNSVVIQLNGEVIATFALNNNFNVITI